ncbi:MAG: sigma-54-dependent Fis family transcriptional regulator [Nitrospirae bacterium]|nr:sigma-54-dependent Fis family transcriptional regulator [Nitrospirota bacterium]
MLLQDNYEIFTAENGREALKVFSTKSINLVLLDILMPDMSGIDVLKKIKEAGNGVEVVMVTAVSDIKIGVEAMKLGAYDYITKPFEINNVLAVVKRAIEKQSLLMEVKYLKHEIERYHEFENIVGKNKKMIELYKLIDKVSPTDSTVLILGESGTGKELVARAIHKRSLRAEKPFIAIGCAAIPEGLLECELFGAEKGAFTGAYSLKIGKFELAHRGTIFLDEVDCLSLSLQAKLLRVLQEKEAVRVGGSRSIKTDVRIVASSNKDLKKEVEAGNFREDLFYRLNVIPITLPPLRERKDDIPLLVTHFLNEYNKTMNKQIQGFSKEVIDAFIKYDWPGNIRELKNIIERIVVLVDKKIVSMHNLPIDVIMHIKVPINELPLREAQFEFERQYLLKIMEKTRWNKTRAAKALGIHRNTLLLKLNQLGLKRPQ